MLFKGNKYSNFRIFDESHYFPWEMCDHGNLFSLAFYIVKAIVMKFLEDQDVGILYLSTKFELDSSSNNGDLLSDSENWKRTQTNKHTQRLTLLKSDIGSSKYLFIWLFSLIM